MSVTVEQLLGLFMNYLTTYDPREQSKLLEIIGDAHEEITGKRPDAYPMVGVYKLYYVCYFHEDFNSEDIVSEIAFESAAARSAFLECLQMMVENDYLTAYVYAYKKQPRYATTTNAPLTVSDVCLENLADFFDYVIDTDYTTE